MIERSAVVDMKLEDDPDGNTWFAGKAVR